MADASRAHYTAPKARLRHRSCRGPTYIPRTSCMCSTGICRMNMAMLHTLTLLQSRAAIRSLLRDQPIFPERPLCSGPGRMNMVDASTRLQYCRAKHYRAIRNQTT
ncbi:hypothetical protein AVEN_252234-1, partial [Araneus ventricosus]